GEPRPIGFGAIAARPSPTLLVVAHMSPSLAAAVAPEGFKQADALLLSAWEDGLEEKAKAWETPWGIWVKKKFGTHMEPIEGGGAKIYLTATSDQEAADRFKKLGADFLVLGMEADAAILLKEDLGFVLAIEEETPDGSLQDPEGMPDTLLRTLEALPLDGLLLSLPSGPLTLRRQLELRRLGLLSRQTILIAAAESPSSEDLQGLREAGIMGIALLIDQAGKEKGLDVLRQAVDSLPPRRPRREEKPTAILPFPAQPSGEEETEEFPVP
ncbi:MAG TPA: hypothetical protein VI877_03790, partial [Dehalococcoidia bacterium]|nr:hypothetical protein [Dehalococcoidia bacterium]